MSLINTLISKIFTYLKNFGNSTNEQSFEKQLRSYPHEKGHFMIVMISLKGFLNDKSITAIAPPQEGERVGV
jgi:hypothetical protein